MGEKEFLNLVTVLTLHIDPQNLKIPIIGVSQKVTIDDEGGNCVWKLSGNCETLFKGCI